MKGRLYDPKIGRFLTTDPFVSHPSFGQSWNPYSYVVNNPLAHTDPSGFVTTDTTYSNGKRDVVFDPDPLIGKVPIGPPPPPPPPLKVEASLAGLTAAPGDMNATGNATAPTPQGPADGTPPGLSPQPYDYANPDQSGPNAGYVRFDPDPGVRDQQDAQVDQNIKNGGRGLGEFIWGELTGDQGLANDGLRRYAEATGIVESETIDAVTGVFDATGSGTGAKRGPKPWPDGAHNITIARRILELVLGGHDHINGGEKAEEVVDTEGGSKSSRRPDITTIAPDGSIHRENVGRTTTSGQPVKREAEALDDLERVDGKRPTFTPYDR
jgi:hypothetical protein